MRPAIDCFHQLQVAFICLPKTKGLHYGKPFVHEHVKLRLIKQQVNNYCQCQHNNEPQ